VSAVEGFAKVGDLDGQLLDSPVGIRFLVPCRLECGIHGLYGGLGLFGSDTKGFVVLEGTQDGLGLLG
jgi:hypothetical protein